jgi:thiol:disulfide interchange protein DsbA
MKKEKKKKSLLSSTSIALIIIAAIAIVAGYIIITNNPHPSSLGGTFEKIPDIEGTYNRNKVEVIELFDFMCPHCYELHKTGIMKKLKEKYGDRIEVRYVGLHFIEDRNAPYDVAILPILAYEYAREKGRGDEMMEALFIAYHDRKMNITDMAILQDMANALGLDTSDFTIQLKSYQDRVKANDDVAFNYYFTKIDPIVPTVIIAGNLKIPAPYYSSFENMDKIISSLLLGNVPIWAQASI